MRILHFYYYDYYVSMYRLAWFKGAKAVHRTMREASLSYNGYGDQRDIMLSVVHYLHIELPFFIESIVINNLGDVYKK